MDIDHKYSPKFCIKHCLRVNNCWHSDGRNFECDRKMWCTQNSKSYTL